MRVIILLSLLSLAGCAGCSQTQEGCWFIGHPIDRWFSWIG